MRKAYSKYKESGVYWIGDIPEHWNVWKISHAFKYISSGTTPPAGESDWYDGDIPWITTTELRENVITEASRSVAKEALAAFSALKIHPKGSFVVAMYGATIGRVALLDIAATTNQACCVLSNSDIYSTELLFFLFQAFRKEIVALSSGGGQPNISQAKIASLKIPIPPIHEQKKIYNYLRVKLNEIDVLVSKKEEFIERLKEKRTALISQVVTKGLPPEEAKKHGLPVNPKMKPSGVDWLGEIPVHWNLSKLKHLFRFKSGGTPNTENSAYWDGEIPWVSPKDMKSFYISETQDSITHEAIVASATSLVPKGTLLMVVRSGILRHTIPVAITAKQMAINQDIKAFIPTNDDIDARYWAFLIQGKESLLLDLWRKSGTTVESIETDLALGTIVPVPKLTEQRAIGDYLSRSCDDIDKLLSRIEKGIEFLLEYRSALITSAVTGKIDVREAVK